MDTVFGSGTGEWTIHCWQDQQQRTMHATSAAAAVAISLWGVVNRDYWTERITGPEGAEIRRPELTTLWRGYQDASDRN